MRRFKRLLSFILVIVSIFSQTSVFAEDDREIKAIMVEMEKGEVLQGDFKPVSNAQMSGKSGMMVHEYKASKSELKVEFDIDQTGEYDIQLCSTLGNTDYVSKMKWRIDDEEYLPYNGVTTSAGYNQGMYGVPIFWCKLDTRTLEAGKHSFSVLVEDIRDMGEFMLAFCDVLAIAPSEWGWEPYGVNPPYNSEDMKFSFAGGKISTERVYQEGSFNVEVTTKCEEETPYQAVFLTELRYKGQKVTDSVDVPPVPTSKWKKDKTYKHKAKLSVPFNAPDGVYEVWTGASKIPYVNGNTMEKVGEIKVGEDVVLPKKATAKVSKLDIPATLRRGEEFTVQTEVTANKTLTDATAYLEFYSGEELWYVAELGKISERLTENHKTELSLKGIINEDVPDGEYSVHLGIHTVKAEGEIAQTEINGGVFSGERTYKPMSNGKYIPNKTGNCHFWYVNQNHALIWDGEPYIPIGGMVCSNYIIWFDYNDPVGNKARWDADMAMLKELHDNGIEHIYLNTNRWLNGIPNWAWESYFEELEKLDIKYGVQFSSSHHESDYYAIRAAKARIEAKATGSGIVEAESDVNFVTAGTASIVQSSCAYVAVDDNTSQPVDSGTGMTSMTAEGKMKFTADIKVQSGGHYTVYFTPWVSVNDIMYVDPFKYRVEQEADYKLVANSFGGGDNFRDFIDILSNESGFVNAAEAVRLTGDLHDAEYAKWLENKYKDIDKLNEDWNMEDKPDSFETAAKLIPLYANTEDDEQKAVAMDMRNNKSYVYNASGLLWDDYVEFREEAFLGINNAASDWIKSTDNTNVPVVIKHISILENYNIQNLTHGGFDGIGGEIYGDMSVSGAKRTYPYAEAEQAKKTMWYIITETNTEENMQIKTDNEEFTYESKEYMHDFFNDHINQGAKGIYDFVVFGNFFAELPVYSYHSKPETYEWSKEFREYTEKNADEIISKPRGDGVNTSYFYPGNQAWWPVTNKRSAALKADDYMDTRIIRFGDELIAQTFDPRVDKNILFVNLENAPATKRYGPKLNEYLNNIPQDERVVYLGLRKDLGELPEIDKYFTDEIIEASDGSKYQVLKPSATSKVIYQTDGKPWAISDGNMYIIANTDWNGGVGENDQYTKVNYIEELGLGQSSSKQDLDKTNGFIDIDSSWAKNDILEMYKQGIIAGKSDELYCPEDNISRAELIAMVFRAIKYRLYDYKGCYDDVNMTDWYAPVMQTANDTKIIASQMLDGKSINPNKAITREEAASIISHVCIAAGIDGVSDMNEFKDVSDISDWATTAMANTVYCGIFSGDDNGRLKPTHSITRAEAASVVKRFMDKYLTK